VTRPTHVLIAASGGAAAGLALNASSTGRVLMVAAALAANAIPDKDRHAARSGDRSGTHWLATGALIALVVWWIVGSVDPVAGRLAGAGFFTGYTLHLLADAMTPMGAPLFGPLSRRPVRLLPFRLRIVSGRPPAGWTRCPYIPIPEQFAMFAVLAVDLVFLLPALTGG
jgi:membrane-bound metal-dependent hydrolase YbcI (DUF457 family)